MQKWALTSFCFNKGFINLEDIKENNKDVVMLIQVTYLNN